MDSSGTFDAAIDTLISTHEPLAYDITIGVSSGSGDATSITVIGFGGNGFLETVGTSLNGSILMQSNHTSRQKYVVVARMGRARICDPKTSPGCTPT
jgi:hypothetical protein